MKKSMSDEKKIQRLAWIMIVSLALSFIATAIGAVLEVSNTLDLLSRIKALEARTCKCSEED